MVLRLGTSITPASLLLLHFILNFPFFFSPSYPVLLFMSSRSRLTKSFPAKKVKVDKRLYPIDATIGTSTVSQSYFSASYPCNIGGVRLTLNNDNGVIYYALMVVRDGQSTPLLNISNPALPLVAPEHDVFLAGTISQGVENMFSTKTQRKLQEGDELVLLLVGTGGSISVDGTLQFFSLV